MNAVEAQGELVKVRIEFQRLDQWLHTLAAGLPRPVNQDEMFECKIPLDLASGIYANIEFLREGPIRQVIEDLADAVRLTAEELARRFRELQEREAAGAVPGPSASSPSPGEANR